MALACPEGSQGTFEPVWVPRHHRQLSGLEDAAKWDEHYPAVSQIWLRHWENIIPIFVYPMEIRRVIYTTNAIESVNRLLRKVIKTKAVFPDEESVFKLIYLTMNNISKRWNRPIKNWRVVLSHFLFCFQNASKFELKSAYTKFHTVSLNP
ncbi:MAG: transposase [Leptolyngbyaceae cyanobacterium]